MRRERVVVELKDLWGLKEVVVEEEQMSLLLAIIIIIIIIIVVVAIKAIVTVYKVRV